VIVADNGSSDGSRELATAAGARVVPVPIRGYGSALLAGIAAAQGECVVMGDADGSYDFTAIDVFLSKLREGNDLVMGNRFRGGIRVTGRLTAKVAQPSVVTLEPLTQDIAEPIDRIFLPGGEKQYAGPANAEIFVDLEGDDVPDHFEGNEADLSDLIVETLALSVDLYPREPDASLEDTGFKPDLDTSSPFDALKALKPKE